MWPNPLTINVLVALESMGCMMLLVGSRCQPRRRTGMKDQTVMKHYPMTHAVKSLTGSRKREFSFNQTDHVQNVDSYWDGGSKDSYRVVNIDTGMNVTPKGNHPFGDHGKVGYKLISGDILIRTGTFCGKPSTPCLLCRVEDEDRVRRHIGLPVLSVLAICRAGRSD